MERVQPCDEKSSIRDLMDLASEGWGDIKPDGWFAHGNWGSKVDDVPLIPKQDLIKIAHEILDRVDANLHFMVESIKAKKYPEG